jgi:hypothetical protein
MFFHYIFLFTGQRNLPDHGKRSLFHLESKTERELPMKRLAQSGGLFPDLYEAPATPWFILMANIEK